MVGTAGVQPGADGTDGVRNLRGEQLLVLRSLVPDGPDVDRVCPGDVHVHNARLWSEDRRHHGYRYPERWHGGGSCRWGHVRWPVADHAGGHRFLGASVRSDRHCACRATDSANFSSKFLRSKSMYSSSTLSASIFERSRISLINVSND